MPYKQVSDLNPDTTIALGGRNKKTGKLNPTSIEGYYIGKRKVDSKKAKSGFCYIYVFQTAQGNVGVWGKTDLDRKMEQVTPGVMTLAEFDKMVPTPNGEMYKFKVSVDAENTIEVSASTEVQAADDYEDDTQEYVSEEALNEEDAEQAAALAAAERQAKVQALIKNKGNLNKLAKN